jgi:predicted ArsR family transcriptional regulator
MERHHGNTRRTIIESLKRQDGLTANDLAQMLDITSMAVRKHLAQLEGEELIVATVERRPVGRPVNRFHLTEAAEQLFPNTSDRLTVELLTDLRVLTGEETVDRLFERRTDRLAEELSAAMAGKSLEDRLETLKEHLDKNGYLATWEQTPEGDYLLKEFHCAVSSVAHTFTQPCVSELDLFRRLLPGAAVTREHHMTEGEHLCCYRIRPLEIAATTVS